jgi:hypothetical protein
MKTIVIILISALAFIFYHSEMGYVDHCKNDHPGHDITKTLSKTVLKNEEDCFSFNVNYNTLLPALFICSIIFLLFAVINDNYLSLSNRNESIHIPFPSNLFSILLI